MVHTTRSSDRFFNKVFVAMALVFGLVAGACGSGADEVGDGDAAPDGGADDDFCVELEAASDFEHLSDGEDPTEVAAAAEQLRDLAAEAPDEVAGAIIVLAEVFDELSALDLSGEGGLDPGGEGDLDPAGESGMDEFARVMELMFAPEVIEAGETLADHAVTECGFDPEDAAERFGTGGDISMGTDPDTDGGAAGDDGADGDDSGSATFDAPNGNGASDGPEISLEDLQEVEDQHAAASWSGKVVSSGVMNNELIELWGKGPDDEYIETEPLTVDESIAACEAVRAAFGAGHRGLEVRVGNGDTALAEGTAEQACAAL